MGLGRGKKEDEEAAAAVMERWARWDALDAHREARRAASTKRESLTLPSLRVIRGDGAMVGQDALNKSLREQDSSSSEEEEEEERRAMPENLEGAGGDADGRGGTEGGPKGGSATGERPGKRVTFEGDDPARTEEGTAVAAAAAANWEASQMRKTRLKLRALGFLSGITMESELIESRGAVAAERDAGSAGGVQRAAEEAAETPAEVPAPADREPHLPPEVQEETLLGIRLRGSNKFRYVSTRTGLVAGALQATQGGGPPAGGGGIGGGGGGNGPGGASSAGGGGASAGTPQRQARRRGLLERQLIGAGVHDSARLFLSWNKGYPGMTLSVIKYDESAESKRRKKLRLSSVIMELPRRRHEVPKVLSDATWLKRRWGTSYARYFDARWAEASGDKVDPAQAAKDEAWDREYDPRELDDSHIRQGKHRTVQSLEGYYLSVLPYTKKKELKAELNEVFREQHPQLPANLTLSKIRNLKLEVLEHVKSLGLELSTGALALVYFEKLVFKGVVGKVNRKLVMSVCLLLAFKFNEPQAAGRATVAALLDDIERVQSLSPKQVLEAEFPVFGHLLFHLNADAAAVRVHFKRLLKAIESTPTKYLGEDLAKYYFPGETQPEAPLVSPRLAGAYYYYAHNPQQRSRRSQRRRSRKAH